MAEERFFDKYWPALWLALYLECAADFRTWLENHHTEFSELLVGFRKKPSAMASITYR